MQYLDYIDRRIINDNFEKEWKFFFININTYIYFN